MVEIITDIQQEFHKKACEFVKAHVEPFASVWDKQASIPKQVISHLGEAGLLGCIIPKEYGGEGNDFVSFGLMNEAFGYGSSSLTVLFTVQNMVAIVLTKWGTEAQRSRWLAPLATGESVASFALTEPQVAGSDIQAIETTFTRQGNGYYLNGTKKWITFAGIADVFLVFGKLDGQPLACLVERNSPGVNVMPIEGMLGFRACHLAQVSFEQVEIPPESLVGKPGFALAYIAPYGLHYGRLSTAFSAAGLSRACLQSSLDYTARRNIASKPLASYGTAQEVIVEMGVSYEAGLLLCLRAALAEDQHSPEAVEKVIMAKYYTSRAAVRAATEAVQLLGAWGCHEEASPTARYFRDAKIMEIIEGTNQVLQTVLAPIFRTRFRTIEAALEQVK